CWSCSSRPGSGRASAWRSHSSTSSRLPPWPSSGWRSWSGKSRWLIRRSWPSSWTKWSRTGTKQARNHEPRRKRGRGRDRIEQQLLIHVKNELVSSFKGDLQPETELAGIIDSTAILELVVWIEGSFGFTVELDDINPDNFGSVRQLAQWIQKSTEGEAA